MADVTVVGGGIIGLCSALALQDRGYTVEIIERDAVARGASYGNCGLLAPSEIVPISRPGVMKKVPGWLLDPEGPLYIRSRALAGNLGWLLRFVAAGRPGRVRAIATALVPVMRRAESDYRALLDETGQPERLSRAENLMLFNGPDDVERDAVAWNMREEFGFKHERLTRDEVRDLEPALVGPYGHGVLLKDWFHFTDPFAMQQRFADHFESRQGRIIKETVTGLEVEGDAIRALTAASGARLDVERVVLAAGAWSGDIARLMGLRVPIAHLQGYHAHVLEPNVALSRALYYAPGSFVLTPMETGLRIGGTIEIAGPDPEPDYRRADILAERARRLLPDLDLRRVERWMGPRPFMPDTLPIIGRSPRHSNAVLAFGHGQIGMTMGATTGRLVAELVAGREPSVDLAPFAVQRFMR